MSNVDLIETLERVFKTVIDRARSDHDFAEQLLTAFGQSTVHAGATVRRAKTIGAPDISIDSKMTAEDIRSLLARHTRDQIYALVRSRNIAPNRTSSFNKTQLVEHVVRYYRRSEGTTRKLDY